MFNLVEFLSTHKLIDAATLDIGFASDLPYFTFSTKGVDSKYVTYYYLDTNSLEYKSQTVRLGKYLRMTYPSLTPSEITHICEKYKSIIEEPGTFRIIEGDELKESYFRTHYVPNHGTLHNSCMRYLKCQRDDYFKLYGDNAKMLIMTPKRGKRLLGRAILWEHEGVYLMDRVYSAENFIEHQFYEYAKSQGFYVLARNTFVDSYRKNIQKWLTPEDNYKTPKELKITIDLKEPCEKWPFVDSFCYLSEDKTAVSTFPSDFGYMLHNTDGTFYFYAD